MNKLMMSLIILLTIGAITGAVGQVFLKMGINQIGIIRYSNLPDILKSILQIITNHFVLTGLAFSAVAAFSGMILLSQNNLNFVYPLSLATLFIAVLLCSKIFLKESFNLTQILAITIIFAGIVLLVKSKPS